ncbi:MAG: hypothetical protein ACE5H0_00250 [Bacteroidota bacterium]
MKRHRIFLCFVVLTLLHVRPALAQSKAEPGFDKLKALAGEWQGKNPDGTPLRLTYQLFSGGSALVETMEPGGDHPSMITVYHLDGDNLMMTHYCSAQNQPRMRAKPVASKVNKIEFSFVDATNLANPSDGCMHKLVVTFVDDDHITQEWTFLEDDKESPWKFEFERNK